MIWRDRAQPNSWVRHDAGVEDLASGHRDRLRVRLLLEGKRPAGARFVRRVGA